MICYIDANYVADSNIKGIDLIPLWDITELVFSGMLQTGLLNKKRDKGCDGGTEECPPFYTSGKRV